MPKRQHMKARSTTSDIASETLESPTKPRLSRTQSKRTLEQSTSDEATAAFVRRTLCGHQIRSGPGVDGTKAVANTPSLEETLPPLTSSNAVDLQLYALIAIIIKDFVQTWYSKISPDQQFTDKVLQIIAHCTRALEERIRHIDIEALLLDELPALVDAHVTAFRTAIGNSYTASLGVNAREVYHSIHPHPALSPVPQDTNPVSAIRLAENEMMWRHLLVQAALSQLLPPEEIENPCLSLALTDILSEVIIGNAVCGKLCEGWFIWETTTKLINLVRPGTDVIDKPEKTMPTPSRLEQFGLVPDAKAEDTAPTDAHKVGAVEMICMVLWNIVQSVAILALATRDLLISWSNSVSLPARQSAESLKHAPNAPPDVPYTDKMQQDECTKPVAKRPVLSMSAWSCSFHILSLDLRMPWISAICNFLQWFLIYGPGKVGCTNSRLDRLISHHLFDVILTPDRVPSLLLAVRVNLFPNNTLGQGRLPPTNEEVLEIKRRCASAIDKSLPSILRSSLFLSSQDEASIQQQIEEMLDVFGDPYMNKHLMFAITDLLFSRLFPEIQEESIASLLDGM
ncbi:hypothetical protein AAFC00_004663 [Neodothiora populina]